MKIEKMTEKQVITCDMTKAELLKNVKEIYQIANFPGYNPAEIVQDVKEFTEDESGAGNFLCIPGVNAPGCFSMFISKCSGKRKYSLCMERF